MSHQAYDLSADFIEELWQRMNTLVESSASSEIIGDLLRAIKAVPTREQLAAIMNGAFWTSYSLDEGNMVTVSILFDQAEESFDTFLFDEPISFDVKTIVKLGAALQNPRADIGVWPDDEGELKIWGFKNRSENVIIANLWIQAMGPGRVLVTFGGKGLGALINQKAVFVDHTNLMRLVIPKLVMEKAEEPDRMLMMLRYTSLLTTARAMRAHGRGGTLLVVPDSQDWRSSVDSPVPYTGAPVFWKVIMMLHLSPLCLLLLQSFFQR